MNRKERWYHHSLLTLYIQFIQWNVNIDYEFLVDARKI